MNLTDAEFKAFANRVLNDRIARCADVGATKKGRIIAEFHGEPSLDELEWDRIQRESERRIASLNFDRDCGF